MGRSRTSPQLLPWETRAPWSAPATRTPPRSTTAPSPCRRTQRTRRRKTARSDSSWLEVAIRVSVTVLFLENREPSGRKIEVPIISCLYGEYETQLGQNHLSPSADCSPGNMHVDLLVFLCNWSNLMFYSCGWAEIPFSQSMNYLFETKIKF